jgi:disulfide bond formation protein DsbB
MLKLLGAELGDVGRKLGIVGAKRVELRAVMLVDFRLDRVGAGERRFLGISMAGWNAILSLGGAAAIAALLLRSRRA